LKSWRHDVSASRRPKNCDDAVVARDIAKTLEEQAGPASSRAVGVVIGWCGRGVADGHVLLEYWQAFRRADRFW
jgi:hypothetical protein